MKVRAIVFDSGTFQQRISNPEDIFLIENIDATGSDSNVIYIGPSVATGLMLGSTGVSVFSSGAFTASFISGTYFGDGTSLSGVVTPTIGDSRYILTSSYSVLTGSKKTIFAIFDGGGSVISVGAKSYINEVPYNCTITGWRITSPISGSVVVDVYSGSYAQWPATSANTIAGSEKPTLSNAAKNENKALTTWTTPISGGSHLVFNIDSATTVTYVTLEIFLKIP